MAALGLGAALILAQFSTSAAHQRDAERKTDIKSLQLKVTEYYAINAHYPLALGEISDLPAPACRAPNSKGTCAQPDYTYKAFKDAGSARPAKQTDCDNKTTPCGAFIIYTYSMEKLPNPYQVPAY